MLSQRNKGFRNQRSKMLHAESCRERPQDVAELRYRLSRCPADLLDRPQEGRLTSPILPLHHACKCLHIECVRALLEAGARADSKAPASQHNAIHYAVFGNLAPAKQSRVAGIVQLLVQHRAQDCSIYTHEDLFKEDAQYLIEHGFNSVVKLLLQSGEWMRNLVPENDLPKCYTSTASVISQAIVQANVQCMKLFVLHGFEVPNYIFYEKYFTATPIKIVLLFQEQAILPLKIFHNFGGKLLTNHVIPGTNDMVNVFDFLREHPEVTENVTEIEAALEEMAFQPMSLKSRCRLALWKQLGAKYVHCIPHLELPVELKQYLSLCDI